MSVVMLKYAVKISPKARNVRLKMTVKQGLRCLCHGFDPAAFPRCLQQK